MKKKIPLLAGILVLQLVVAFSVFLWSETRTGDFSSEPLMSFVPAQLDKLTVSDGVSEVVLSKKGEQWQLSGTGLPIAEDKLDRLLEKLKGLQTSWPVTTTSSSHERFEVSDSKMRRKISLYQGDKTVAELYIGTSPGFKKSHVRVDDRDEVYALEFNAYDVPATTKEWLDKSLLAVKSVTKIKGKGYSLSKEGESWLIDPLQEKREINTDNVDKLVKAVGAFKILDVANNAPEFTEDKQTEIQVDNGSSYSIFLMEEDAKYYVKQTGFDQVFTLSKYEYERLTKPNLESLTTAITVDDATAQSDTDDVTLNEKKK
ncbi:MAG: DUF4340 domain-containing protein [Pseudomonadota bacterium]|nr:DUF4340 domain-containing protein [Pseudomonadota bacterium]